MERVEVLLKNGKVVTQGKITDGFLAVDEGFVENVTKKGK